MKREFIIWLAILAAATWISSLDFIPDYESLSYLPQASTAPDFLPAHDKS
jgi:hypothetical protein